MARFLFVVPPLMGHIRPTLAVGAELLTRDHQVAWAGDPVLASPLIPAGGILFPAGSAASIPDSQGLRGVDALRFLWDEGLIPLARSMRSAVTDAVEDFDPDVVIADQQAMAGALVARQHSVPWVTSATTSAELVNPLEGLPKLQDWVDGRIASLYEPADEPGELRFSDELVLIFSTEALVVSQGGFPGHYVFVGPAIPERPPALDFPWDWFNPEAQYVLASVGTVTREAGADFLRRVVKAFPDPAAGVRLIVVAPPGTFGTELPPHVMSRPQVPQLALLPFLDAVITHAGHNTVCESLAHGVPLVVAPIRDDQPVVAQQVVQAGAGVQVRYGRVRPDELRAAVLTVLDDPAYLLAAERIRASFRSAGGAAAAADRLAALAVASRSAPVGDLGDAA